MADQQQPSIHENGQSLVEYTLIVVLCILALAFALAATGPAIGNVFSNTIFNLIGQTAQTVGSLPNESQFWATVTWQAQVTPNTNNTIPTNTPQPETLVPTAGPSPTQPTATATYTPSPTATITATPTPPDMGFVAPWTDTANNEQVANWRLDNSVESLSRDDWHVTIHPSTNFTGTPNYADWLAGIPGTTFGNLSFNWSGAPVTGANADGWSLVARRRIFIPVGDIRSTLNFDVPSVQNGGVRVWILGGAFGGSADMRTGTPGSCTSRTLHRAGTPANNTNPVGTTANITASNVSTIPTPANRANRNDGFQAYDDAYSGYNPITNTGTMSTDCLVVDRWISENNNRGLTNVRRTVPAGSYLVVVEFSHTTGTARIAANVGNVRSSFNPNDAQVDNAGVPVANGMTNCNWGNVTADRADSPTFYWEEYRNSNFAANMQCYLEVRGWVEVPASLPNPRLTFWDVWDFRPGVDAWVEIADYDPNNDGIFDRTQLVWRRVNIRSGDSFNYNWTFNSIDLAPDLASSTSRKLAVRFGMRRTDATSNEMRWLVDTIAIDQLVHTSTFYTSQNFDLNQQSQRANFITSGQWSLTTAKSTGGMSFHESAGGNTRAMDFNRNGNGAIADGDVRIHSIEFNGFVDLDDVRGNTDVEGDSGDPILTFAHQYALGSLVGLEAQYSTTAYGVGPAVWSVIPSGGAIIPRNQTTAPVSTEFVTVTVPLKDIPVRRFRLRLAMTVATNATAADGWYVDDIKLERVGLKRYLEYPFVDTAEDATRMQYNYTLDNGWGRVAGGNRPAATTTGFAYTESPVLDSAPTTPIDYKAETYRLNFRGTFDVFNDTPANPYSPACTLTPASNCVTDNVTPLRPAFTFWHQRAFATGAQFAIEWKLDTESSTQWKLLWIYNDGYSVSSVPAANGNRSRINRAWEKVSIELSPIINALLTTNALARTNTDKLDDDVNLRIRFTGGSAFADGLLIDDLRIEEYVERTWALWTTGQTRQNNASATIQTNGTNVVGNGPVYVDSLDNSAWFDIWDVGGGWDAVSFTQRDGVLSFHDSTTNVASTTNRAPNMTDVEGTNGTINDRTFNTLEMKTIIDLRGVPITDRPIMYFWTRWYSQQDRDYFGLQISVEDPTNATVSCSGPWTLKQCYQKELGWGPWTTVWSRNGTREYLWERAQVSLVPYAKSAGADGKRIRVRFISDALDTGTHRDGFYVDQIEFNYLNPPVTLIGRNVAGGGSFLDEARSTNNWITEGKWGLTPTIFRGSSGTTENLGGNPWSVSIWDYATAKSKQTNCDSLSIPNCFGNFLNTYASTTTPWATSNVPEIRENWANNGPRNASNVMVSDRFTIRYTMTTPSNLAAGRYTFITTADDGVRLKYSSPQGLPAPEAGDPPNYGTTWNIVNNWQLQGRTTTLSSARLETGKSYTFVLEYFESYTDASIQLSVGSFSFSFTSQPPNGSGRLASDQVATMRSSNASMIAKNMFDLTQSTNPVLAYYTYYELGGTGLVEVSQDGGFTWVQTGLSGQTPPTSLWSTNWYGYYWGNKRDLDFSTGWPASAPTYGSGTTGTFNTQPYNGFTGSPQSRNEGNVIDYNWGGDPGLPGIGGDNFSARFVRKLNTTVPTTLRFTVNGDDGYRLWVNYTPGCAVFNSDPTKPIFSGSSPQQTDRTFSTPNAGCLLIDDWQDQGPSALSVLRTVPAGATIMLDFYENSGGAVIKLDVSQGNFDSPVISGTFTPDDSVSGEWQLRQHDLSGYAGPGRPPIMVRFRLNRLSENNSTESLDANNSNGNSFNYKIAWWLTDIALFEP